MDLKHRTQITEKYTLRTGGYIFSFTLITFDLSWGCLLVFVCVLLPNDLAPETGAF